MIFFFASTFLFFSIWRFFQKKYIKSFFYSFYSLSIYSCWLYAFNQLNDFQNNFICYFIQASILIITTELLLIEEKFIKKENKVSFQLVEQFDFIIIISLIGFFLNLIYFSNSFSLLQSGSIEVNEYKNFAGSDEYLKNLLPGGPLTLTITRLLSLPSILLIPWTIYNLIENKISKAIFSFIGSLNLALLGMVGLSRQGIITLIFTYGVMYLFSFRRFPKGIKNISLILIAIILTLSTIYFSSITISRFGQYDTWWTFQKYDNIDNPVLFSLLYYFGSWVEQSFYLFSNIDLPLVGHGHSTFSLIHFIDNASNLNLFLDRDLFRNELLGADASLMFGLVSYLIMDLGILGMPFYFLYLYFLNKLGQASKHDYFTYLLFLTHSVYFLSSFYYGIIYSYFYMQIGFIILGIFLINRFKTPTY